MPKYRSLPSTFGDPSFSPLAFKSLRLVDSARAAPHRSYKKETEAVRQQAHQNLEDETNALFAKLRQMRGQQ